MAHNRIPRKMPGAIQRSSTPHKNQALAVPTSNGTRVAVLIRLDASLILTKTARVAAGRGDAGRTPSHRSQPDAVSCCASNNRVPTSPLCLTMVALHAVSSANVTT